MSTQEWFNAARAAHQAGDLPRAEGFYRQVIAARENHLDAMHLLGILCHQTGRSEEGLSWISKACETGGAEIWVTRGQLLRGMGRMGEAASALAEALRKSPGNVELMETLGVCLHEAYQYADAANVFGDAVRLSPTGGRWANYGAALKSAGRMDEAIAAMEEAVKLEPTRAETFVNLGTVLKDDGRVDEALAAFDRARKLSPGWPAAESNYLYTTNLSENISTSEMLAAHREWGKRVEKSVVREKRKAQGPLRVGFVSPDFRLHSVGRFLLPLMMRMDRERIIPICYSDTVARDRFTEEFSRVSVFRNCVGMNDEQVEGLVRVDGIDVLLDLAVHSAGNRLTLFARRPAAVQMTYLGYPGTTGLATVDWRLTDAYLDPPAAALETVEKRLYLRSYWCYAPPEGGAEPGGFPMGQAGYVTFGCLNATAKVSERALRVWAQLLRQVAGSKIVLHVSPGKARDRVRGVFQREGIAAERVEFVGFLPTADYVAMYAQKIDVALDPFPYAGGTTTCDALWMGCPVVSLAGNVPVGRAGVSILNQAECGEWVARDEQEYVEIAVGLVNSDLKGIRAGLREKVRRSVLCDMEGFVRDFEQAIWEGWDA